MTTRQFIEKITFVAPEVREKLKKEFEEELDEELTLEIQEWVLERVSDLWEMTADFIREIRL